MDFSAESSHPLQTKMTQFAEDLVAGEAGQQFLISTGLICCIDALHALLQQYEMTLTSLLSEEVLGSPGSPDTLTSQSEFEQVTAELNALKQANSHRRMMNKALDKIAIKAQNTNSAFPCSNAAELTATILKMAQTTLNTPILIELAKAHTTLATVDGYNISLMIPALLVRASLAIGTVLGEADPLARASDDMGSPLRSAVRTPAPYSPTRTTPTHQRIITGMVGAPERAIYLHPLLARIASGNGDPDLAKRAEAAALEAIRTFLTEQGSTGSPRVAASSPPVTPIAAAAAGSGAGGATSTGEVYAHPRR